MTPFAGKNRVTSPYGWRTIFGKRELHRGVDSVPTAYPGEDLPESAWQVRECTGGTVLRVTSDQWRGNYVDVQTAPNTFERYQHLKTVCVQVGQSVPQGTVVGVAGSTGISTARHLHFGVYKNGSAEANAVVPSAWMGIPNAIGTYEGNDDVDGAAREVLEKGIDVSSHQGMISDASWNDIKSKCGFVILRFGYRGYGSGTLKMDEQFARNFQKVQELQIPYGLYYFTQAITPEEGKAEADLVADTVPVGTVPYFVACDTETADAGNGRADALSKEARTAAVKAFCEEIAARGGRPAVYASTSWLEGNLDMAQLPYTVWCADYRGFLGYAGAAMWQTDSKNSLGIEGFTNLDCNLCYERFEAPAPEAKLYIITTDPMSKGDLDTFREMLDGLKENLGVGYTVKEA